MDVDLFKIDFKFIKILFLSIILGSQFTDVFASDHREIDNRPKIDPKVLIKQTTVLIENDKSDTGSGVIVKKEGDIYNVLTAAHVVCNRTNQFVETEEFNLKTADDYWHSNLDGADLKVICPPILMELPEKNYCSPGMNSRYPWPIDLAILKFRSEKKYMVAKKQGSIRRLGKDVYVAGYPFSEEGEFFIRESEGTVDIPPSSITDTCKGYGLRYIVPTEIGMSGGGVWSKKGKLVGIHGYREVSRDNNFVLGSRGSHGTGIHLPYWKQMVDPFDPSQGFPEILQKTKDKENVAALISRARSYINISKSSSINNNPLLGKGESFLILESLKKAQKLDPKQPLIPALIAQVYIRKFENVEQKKEYSAGQKREYLIEALNNINKAIRLYNPLFLEKTMSYDGSFEKIRAYIHFKYGEFINNNKSIFSYQDAIEDIDVRLSAKPDDVAAWKDKAKYHFYAGQLNAAYQSLIKASILAPKDPSIVIDMGIVLYNIKDYKNACKEFNRANILIEKGFRKQGDYGAFAKDYNQQKDRITPYKEYLGC
ncbi:serine protease [uncultured Prochlorococcus sp.]|uniref:serine protease n=1 Tax=uncultured Prochlorococcus sp. TaxID=159733 RepID=UPI0025895D8A|nr:serine protease [uncultured Prochlorococcus sp.]